MMMMEFLVFGLFLSILDPKCWTWLESYESWHYNNDIIRSKKFDLKSFGFETFPCFLWYRYRFRNFLVSKKVSVSVSKNFGIGKSIGFGFGNFWYRKKYRYRFRKILVSKKVSVLVSKNFGIEKSIGIGFEKFWSQKKYRYRFRKILYWKRTQIFMIYSITLNLEQYEPRKVFLIRKSGGKIKWKKLLTIVSFMYVCVGRKWWNVRFFPFSPQQ